MSLESWYPEELGRRAIERQGIRLDVPHGWEGRIRQQGAREPGSRTYNVVHAATIPLTGERADYGGGCVERLGANDVFVSLIEFGPEAVGSALYPIVEELPRLEVRIFHRNQLQRRLRGQAGVQRFFTINGRAFCLYVVLGSIANAVALVEGANALVAGISVDPQ